MKPDREPRAPTAFGDRLRALAVALAGGAAWGLCHGQSTRPWLAAVALAPLLLLGDSRRPFFWGWLYGVVAWCVAIPWIVPTLTIYGHLDGWLAALALVLLASYLGLFEALFASCAAPLWRRGDPLSLAALPALWVAVELLRGWLLSGFPWNLAAYAWIDVPGALSIGGWVGAFGVSALVLVANLAIARAVATRRWEPAALGLFAAATLLALGARFAVSPDPRPDPRHRAPERLEVRVLQPNTPNRPVYDAAANAGDYRRLLEMSDAVCAPGRLLIWPESAAWPRSWQDDPQLRRDVARLTRRGCALLFNTSFDESGRTFNSVLLVERRDGGTPRAPGTAPPAQAADLALARADKRHLVPFGEFVPLRQALPFLGKIARTVGDFTPASEVRLLEVGGAKLGAAVCYEVIFAGETSELVAAGATVLVTVTNDAWYGDTAAPRQHLRAARFRAAENRRWLLRAAITGISAVVRADGSLAGQLPVGRQGVLAASVPPRGDLSPFARAPWLVPALCSVLAALAIVRERLRALRVPVS